MEVLGLLDVPVSLILTVGVVVLLYIYLTWNHNFFKKQGIPGPPPNPIVGNTLGQGMMDIFLQGKKKYGNVFGCFVVREPVFVISDLDILKEIFVKSFNNFRNRRKFALVVSPFNLAVAFLEDDDWKRVRNIITPTFSGGKLRAMCPAINDCSRTLTNNFGRTLNKGKSVDMKEYFGAYTMDVIARTAFGVKVDSQNDFNEPFTSNVRKAFNPSPVRMLFFIVAAIFPFLIPFMKSLGVSFFPKDVRDFFVTNITDMIKQREMDSKEVKEKRADFLQLLIDAEITEKSDDVANGVSSNGVDSHSVRHLTADEIIGQGFVFFAAGYETTATTLNFTSYILATHPDVQEKVYQEIKDVLGDDEPDYDNIGKMPYLEKVINETLRLYPPAVTFDRRAAETITIKGVTIPQGSTVFIPTFSIQRDPELFEDPEEFKPERFDEKVNPISFLAFGYGPRHCIGMRLALVEAKIALVHVLRKVKFEPGPDPPMKLAVKNFNNLQPKVPNRLMLSARC